MKEGETHLAGGSMGSQPEVGFLGGVFINGTDDGPPSPHRTNVWLENASKRLQGSSSLGSVAAPLRKVSLISEKATASPLDLSQPAEKNPTASRTTDF